MLKVESMQINRYKGIDESRISIVHEELRTLKQLKALDKEKQNITAFNKAHHVNIKGFSSNFHNYNRSSDNYSIAENLFREILELNNISFIHEHKIQIRDALLNAHNYHLDFFIPDIKLAIEISPLFHFTYETVAIRDKLRESLLLRKQGIKTLVIKVHFRTRKKIIETYLNSSDTDKAIKTIKQLKRKPHKETLLYYCRTNKKASN
jgi:hypothetical protein